MASCFWYIDFVARGGSILKIALLTVLVAVQPVASASGGVDPRIGSWTLISAKSNLNPPDKLTIADLHGDVHVVMSGETHLDFTVKRDGHDTAVAGNPGFDQVELHKIDKRQAEVSEKKNGALVGTVRESLSKDGNELTVATASKGRGNQITVWVRGAGGKSAGDPLAGEWIEDLSKTRMRQGTVLMIEADGSNGVRFTWDASYTARFDGKPYDVRNSRNDSVTLQLVDPHTVNATYRRDDQVTQNEKWVVSADGQQMTVTTTATLESGQHLTETLVFKKQ